MSSALPLYNLKYPLDYFKFTIGITLNTRHCESDEQQWYSYRRTKE